MVRRGSCPTAPAPRRRSRLSARSASAMPAIHCRGRETPRRFAVCATAINPPSPPSALISASTASSACCKPSPPMRTRAANCVRGSGADEIFAGAGRGDRGRAVVGIGAGADQRRIADPAPALAGQPAGRGRGGDMAVRIDRNRANRAIFDVGVESAVPRHDVRRAGAGARRSRTSRFSTCSKPCSRAKRSAPSPARKTCGLCSITARARLIGRVSCVSPATAPARARARRP